MSGKQVRNTGMSVYFNKIPSAFLIKSRGVTSWQWTSIPSRRSRLVVTSCWVPCDGLLTKSGHPWFICDITFHLSPFTFPFCAWQQTKETFMFLLRWTKHMNQCDIPSVLPPYILRWTSLGSKLDQNTAVTLNRQAIWAFIARHLGT